MSGWLMSNAQGLPDPRRAVWNLVYLALAGLVAAIIVSYAHVLLLRRKLPPGPFPLPIIGNQLQIPLPKPWVAFEKWSQYYNSPLITLWIGRRPEIIVNDAWVAHELTEKRASNYSDRPRHVVHGELLDAAKLNQTYLPYGDQWRTHRMLMHQAVGTHVLHKYRNVQSDEAILLLKDLVERPGAFVKCIERYAVSVASIVGWGRRIDGLDDYVAKQALLVMDTIDYAVPGAAWTEAIPEMAILPRWLHRFPHDMRALARLGGKYFCMLTREAAAAREDSGLARSLVERQAELQLSDAEIGAIAGNVIGGGVDTTSSSLLSFILAMCVFTDAQAAAHQELDRVVGRDRMPGPQDMSELPYITAMVKETLRWRTVTILAGIPHAPLVDDVYEGYTIPKGTGIVGNMWAIHRNPRDFSEPDRFKPERYLGGKLERPYPVARGHHAFGFGRRVCSGQPQAEQGLALAIAKLMWAFKIRPGVDANGRTAKVDIFAYTNGENIRPEPFPAIFEPRSKEMQEILYKEADRARKALNVYDGQTKLTMLDVM